MTPLPTSAKGLQPIPLVARLMGRPYRTVFRLLMAMAARDREAGVETDWLLIAGPRKMYVNHDRLRRRHPALYSTKYAKPEDIENMAERLDDMEQKVSETRLKVGSVAARVREVARRRV